MIFINPELLVSLPEVPFDLRQIYLKRWVFGVVIFFFYRMVRLGRIVILIHYLVKLVSIAAHSF
jgi:hypothetical protein